MDKIALYLVVVLTYLGLANSLSPFRQYVIKDEMMLGQIFPSENLSVILDEMDSLGLFIQTKFHVYKVFYGYSSQPEYHRFQVSNLFYENHEDHLGMSILNRGKSYGEEYAMALPPGAPFVGDPLFGRWVNTGKGQSFWSFHSPYKQLPQLLGWETFIPTKNFVAEINQAIEERRPYFGPNNEFGTKGKLTKLREKKRKPGLGWQKDLTDFIQRLKFNPYQEVSDYERNF